MVVKLSLPKLMQTKPRRPWLVTAAGMKGPTSPVAHWDNSHFVVENGIWVIKCPNAGNPGIANNAKKTTEHIRAKVKKQQHQFKKCKNLATTNYADFDEAIKERIWQQVLQAVSTTSDAASVTSSITVIMGDTSSATASAGCGHGRKPVIFLYNVQVLQTKTH
jgi:hypothetical protein